MCYAFAMASDQHDSFAKRLRHLMAAARMSPRELARAADVAEATVYRHLSSTRTQPESATISAYAQALGVSAYRCQARFHLPPAQRHAPMQKSLVVVEAVLWFWVGELLSGDVIAEALSRLSAPPSPPSPPPSTASEPRSGSAGGGGAGGGGAPLPSPSEELTDLEGRIAYNLEVAQAGGLPPDLLARQNAPLLARREELLRVLRQCDEPPLDPAALRWLREAGPELVQRLAALEDRGRQRRFLERLFTAVELHPEGLEFVHALPIPRQRIAWPAYHGPLQGWDPPTLTHW